MTPVITLMEVFPVAGKDAMLLNLSERMPPIHPQHRPPHRQHRRRGRR
jgi:hypothetical protein